MDTVPAFAQYEAGLTIRDISPIQLYPVASVPMLSPVPLPAPDDGDAGQGLAVPAASGPVAVSAPSLSVGYVPAPYVASAGGNAVWASPYRAADVHAQAWLPAPGTADPLSLGARNWSYASASGVDVTVGNTLSQAPLWAQPVRLAGLGVRGSPSAGRQGGAWQYAMTVGALDDSSDDTVDSGGLAYGPAASDTFVKYDAAPSLSLTSQVQWAPDLLAVGAGGQYGLGNLGSWTLGVSRAQQTVGEGWRYQLGYQVDVLDDWQLSWINTHSDSGYTDLSGYAEGLGTGGSVGNQWAVKVPLGRWGDLSGTYEQRDAAQGTSSQTFGLAQQFWYGPDLQVRVEANRNIVTDDYGLGLNLSFPLN